MSGIVRDEMQTIPDGDLLAMWAETVSWEQTGTLPNDATIRRFLTERIAPKVAYIDVHAMWLDMIAKEVWRECAVRRLEVPR